ncbi:alpha/beta hydrolase [Nocardiopsis tropica]|uniref:alpha/beta hydrolase n=1 Tax=Nocardiopsis tropica TaxID=109330 RepID=UPI0031DEA42F
MKRDPRIAWRHALAARALQLTYPAMNRLLLLPPEVEFATKPIAAPTTVRIPTRHGDIGALVFSPTSEDIESQLADGRSPPVHMLIHGGGFITRYPLGEGNVARYLASELGCYVVMPDYRAAPQVCHPVAGQECYDAYLWVRGSGAARGWDGDRVSVGGPSAGGHLSLGVALTAIERGAPSPAALSVEFAPVDLTLPNAQRTSTRSRPIVGDALMDTVMNTYFAGADTSHPLVSPALHPALDRLPPTLVITAEHDTLRDEADRFADSLRRAGVEVTHRMFEGVDHGFIYHRPAEPARAAISLMGDHLGSAFRRSR